MTNADNLAANAAGGGGGNSIVFAPAAEIGDPVLNSPTGPDGLVIFSTHVPSHIDVVACITRQLNVTVPSNIVELAVDAAGVSGGSPASSAGANSGAGGFGGIITIQNAAPVITSGPPPNGQVGKPYSLTFTANFSDDLWIVGPPPQVPPPTFRPDFH